MFINTPCHPNIDVFITKLLKIEGTTDQQGGAANKLSWREHFNIGSKCGGSSTRAEGFHLPIRQMTNSLLGFAFLRSASTSQPFFFSFFKRYSHIQNTSTYFDGKDTVADPPPNPLIHLFSIALVMADSGRLTVLADIEEAIPEITLPAPAHFLTPTNTFFPHTLDSKQNLHLASRHEKLSHLGFRSFFSPHGPLDDLTKG